MQFTEENGHYIDPNLRGEKKFTAFTYLEGREDELEEIDVKALDRKHATDIVLAVLASDHYVPGCKIYEIQEREAGIIYI